MQGIDRSEFERATAEAVARLPVPFFVLAPSPPGDPSSTGDTTFRVIWANETAHRFTGHAPDAPWPTIDRFLGHVPALEDDVGRVHRDREVLVRVRPVDREGRIDHLRLVLVPLEGGVALFVQDVSHEAGVREELDIAERSLERVQQWGQMGVWEIDLAASEQYWSSQVYAILDVEDSGVETFRRAVHPDDLGLVDHVLRRALEQPGPYKFNHRVVRGDEIRTVSQHVQSVPGTDGTPERLLGAIIDVTTTQALEQQLHQSQRARSIGLLAGGLAHDFNNALAILLGHIDTVARHEAVAGDPALSLSLDAMQRATRRASALTRKLMSLGQHGEPHTEVLLGAEVLQNTAKLVAPALGSGVEVTVESDVDPTAPDPAAGATAIAADATHVEQVLLDLVLNARDAGATTITLRVDRARIGAGDEIQLGWGLSPGAYGVLSVIDDGSGMDDETLRRIFDPFFTTKGAEDGSGLGLTNAERVARRSGGALVATSSPGAGTTMALHLPLVEPEAEPEVDDEVRARPRARRRTVPKPTRVLVAADDPDRCAAIVDVLDDRGHQVVVTTSTAEITWTVATEPIDLVVVDAGLVDRGLEQVLDPDRTVVLDGSGPGALADAAQLDGDWTPDAFGQLVDQVLPRPR